MSKEPLDSFKKYKIKVEWGWLVGIMPNFYPRTLEPLLQMGNILGGDYGLEPAFLSFHHCGGRYNANKTVVQTVVDEPLPEYETVSAEWRG